MTIGFIGLGKLGMQCAEVFATKYETYGYDVIEKQSNTVKITQSIEELVKLTNVIFIAVQTPHEKEYGGECPTSHLPQKDFDYSNLENCVKNVNQYINNSQIIVVISTVLPGTIRKKINPILTNGTVIYNPYLIAMGTVKDDFCHPEMVILGTEDGKREDKILISLIDIYKNLIHKEARYEIGTWEEAESIKIFYNTFISAKIAIVNMIQDVSESIGNINVDIVTQALAKSTKRITSGAYMKAGMGDGGPCHPRDNIALSWLAEELKLNYNIFNVINHTREEQAKKIAKRLTEFNNPIVILGINYKYNTKLTDGSYALLINYYLKELGAMVYLDRNPTDEQICTYLICHESTYNEFPFYKDSIVLDMWRSFTTNRKDLTIYSYVYICSDENLDIRKYENQIEDVRYSNRDFMEDFLILKNVDYIISTRSVFTIMANYFGNNKIFQFLDSNLDKQEIEFLDNTTLLNKYYKIDSEYNRL